MVCTLGLVLGVACRVAAWGLSLPELPPAILPASGSVIAFCLCFSCYRWAEESSRRI